MVKIKNNVRTFLDFGSISFHAWREAQFPPDHFRINGTLESWDK